MRLLVTASLSFSVGAVVGALVWKLFSSRKGYQKAGRKRSVAPAKPVIYIGPPPVKVKSWRCEEVPTAVPTKWLKFRKAIVAFNHESKDQQIVWEYVARPENSAESDGCDVLALFKQPGKPDYVIFVLVYRPPVNKVCVEFPSGLVDVGESSEAAAVRELKEETGFVGTFSRAISCVTYIDPYKSSETTQLVQVEVDGTLAENQTPVPQREEDENMQVLLINKEGLREELHRLNAQGYGIDSKVYAYAAGLLSSA